MKKHLLFIFTIGFTMLGCNHSKKVTALPEKYPNEYNGTADVLFSETEFESGKDLIAQNDCFTCHRFADKSVGPALQEISKKYEQLTTEIFYKLSYKIRNGGGGNWGNIPMAPHPSLNADQSELILKYILLTKYKKQ